MVDTPEMKIKITAETDDSQIKKEWEKAWKEIAEWVWKWTKSNKGAIAEIGKEAWETFWQSFSDQANEFLFKKLKFDSIKDAIINIWTQIKDFFVDSVDLANKYESAFAWVRKTVDWTEADFKKLDSSLRKMAKEIPIAYEDLASIMELWWQLGVDIQNMDKFTKVIAELWVATNMTAEESAQMLAQFANITKMDLNDIDKLWSVIVALGNNFATTENDITNFASRIAGAGQIAWISQANIMAIATAFSSVWIEAEAWGTAVQKVLLQMNNAVVQWGGQLETYAKTLWITAEEFKTLFDEHPEKAFEEFVKGLSTAWDEAQLVLSELWLNDERLTRAFLSLAQNSGILTDAIEMSNEARDDNLALMNEAEQRFATTESQLIMLQNERANLMASIWEKLQDVSLTWEQIKTSMLEIAAWMLWVDTTTSEYTDVLTSAIDDEKRALEELQYQYDSTMMSYEEYEEKRKEIISVYSAYKKEKDEEIKQMEEEQEKLDELKKQRADLTREIEESEAQLKERNETWKHSQENIDMLTEIIEKQKDKLAELTGQLDETKNTIVEENEIRKVNAEWMEAWLDLSKQMIETDKQIETAHQKRWEQMQIINDLQEELNQLTEQYWKDNEEVKKKQLELDKTRKELATTEANVDNLSQKLSNLWNLFNSLWGKATNKEEATKLTDTIKKYKAEMQKIASEWVKVPVTVETWWDNKGWTWWWTNKTKSWWSWKKSDPVTKAKEQAKQIRDEKIKALEQEELDELEKNKRLDEIYTEYKNKILELDWKTNDDMLKNAEDFLKDYRKNKQDEIEAEKKAWEDSIKNIEKYWKEIEKLWEKREDYKNEAVKNLREVNKELEDLEKENTENLADRYLEVEKAIRDLEKENSSIKYYDSTSIEQLQKYQKDWLDNYWGVDIDKLIEYKKLQTEINLLKENTTEETIKEAQERKNLTETEKQLIEYEEKKTQLLEKQAILQATANQGNLGDENKALIEEDGVMKYYDAEKQAYTEITDYKNQELARQLLEKQTEMESEYQLNVEQKEKEEALLQEHYDKLQTLYQSDTEIYKGELAKKEKAVRDYVERVKAMLAQIPASHRAYGGNLLNGQVSIVGENWPEAIIARQSSYVQPRNAVQNSSTVYNNQSSLSINGLEFWSFNNIDEMLIALKDKLTYRS